MDKTIIIAEAGVNHNGSVNLAKDLALVAKKCGADYIKYQTFITEKTFKPIMYGHPFIVLGNPGIMSQLESWGFMTFNNLFDQFRTI